MSKAWWALLVVGCAMAAAPQGSSKEFVLALPETIESARVVVELSDVRLPRKAAVIFRARAIDEAGAEVTLGSVGLLAESSDAEGTALHAAIRIDVTKALKRWRLAHPEANTARIRVVPYAGGEPFVNLEWSAGAAGLKVVTP